jgi:hypothetical protein
MDAAAYRVIEDILDYDKLGGMKKQQSDVVMQIYVLNEIRARQNQAITTLFKLQAFDITGDEILNVHECLNRAISEYTATIPR